MTKNNYEYPEDYDPKLAAQVTVRMWIVFGIVFGGAFFLYMLRFMI